MQTVRAIAGAVMLRGAGTIIQIVGYYFRKWLNAISQTVKIWLIKTSCAGKRKETESTMPGAYLMSLGP